MSVWIKGADWIVAWDEDADRHIYLEGGDVVFEGNAITFVGRSYAGAADEIVDGAGLAVIPGLVNLHSHPNSEPAYRGIREEHGVPTMFNSGLYERDQAFAPDAEGRLAGAEVAYCELLLSGTTTLAELSRPYPGWLQLLSQSGLRGYVAAGFSAASWTMENDYEVRYVWDEAAERRGFEDALAVLDEAEAHECGRLTGIVYPAQIDTCSTDVLVDAHAESVARNRPFTTHAAQSVIEFREIIHRHGKTPIQWAHAIGILGENTILGHALFTDEHSWTPWPTGSDISILAETGTSVAHCPTPFSRYGHVLENFGRYRGAGVRMGLGTDVTPQNLIEEMRTAVITARIAAGDVGAVTAADVFEAATIGGAGALMRNDLGRIAPGAKADIVLLDTRHPLMMPVHDLLRSLVYSAAERAVRDVYVDGLQVVKDRKVTTLDHMGALERLTEAQARMLRDAPNRDYLGRQADEIVPLSLERR